MEPQIHFFKCLRNNLSKIYEVHVSAIDPTDKSHKRNLEDSSHSQHYYNVTLFKRKELLIRQSLVRLMLSENYLVNCLNGCCTNGYRI